MINLFSTPVKIISMPNFEDLSRKIGKAMKLGFEKNFTDNLPSNEAEDLQKIFINEAELYLKELTNKKIDLNLIRSWTSVTNKYGFNTPHDHAGNTVIGVYYVKTFDKCGDLLLHDPRGATDFIPVFEVNTSNQVVSGRNYFRITPKNGDLILFPTYVVHSVEPNMSDETRISLAMNFKYKDFDQFKPD